MENFEYYLNLLRKGRKPYLIIVIILSFTTTLIAFLSFKFLYTRYTWIFQICYFLIILFFIYSYLHINNLIKFTEVNYPANKKDVLYKFKKSYFKRFNSYYIKYINKAYKALLYEDVYIKNIKLGDYDIVYSYDMTTNYKLQLEYALNSDEHREYIYNIPNMPKQFINYMNTLGLNINEPAYFELGEEDGHRYCTLFFKIIGYLENQKENYVDGMLDNEIFISILQHEENINVEEYLVLDLCFSINLKK